MTLYGVYNIRVLLCSAAQREGKNGCGSACIICRLGIILGISTSHVSRSFCAAIAFTVIDWSCDAHVCKVDYVELLDVCITLVGTVECKMVNYSVCSSIKVSVPATPNNRYTYARCLASLLANIYCANITYSFYTKMSCSVMYAPKVSCNIFCVSTNDGSRICTYYFAPN